MSIGFFEELINQIKSEYNVDEDRIYAFGHSFGAAMTYSLGCRLTDTFAAIVPMSGLDWSGAIRGCNNGEALPTFLIQGKRDWLQPALMTRRSFDKMRRFNQCNRRGANHDIGSTEGELFTDCRQGVAMGLFMPPSGHLSPIREDVVDFVLSEVLEHSR